MRVHKLVVPTPFYVGPVNVYLLDDDPLTLLDVGPNTPEAWETLNLELKRVGRELSEIRRVVISHAHADHFGLAHRVQQASGARIFIHDWDARGLMGDPDYACHRALLERAGVPPDVISEFQKDDAYINEFRGEKLDVVTLKHDEELLFRHAAARVVHTPGHTPGSICLMRESTRHLLAADTLLRHITPNPMLHSHPEHVETRFSSLGSYLESAEKLRELEPTLIQTGHGEDIHDIHEHCRSVRGHSERRQEKVLETVRASRTVTAWELSKTLFPHVRRIHRFLAVSEAQAHLDFARSQGKLKVEKKGLAEIFSPIQST